MAALSAQINGDKRTQMVEDALKAGKLQPALKDWALKQEVTALQAFIDVSPVMPLQGQSKGEERGTGATGVDALSATQKSVAQQLGIEPAKYAELLKAAA